ncbi:hypothetical protein CR513_52019, partial [Mucuna pruriens]
MKRMFFEKFFLASKTPTIRKEVCGIRQHSGEILHEFNKLCATCPHHQISEQLLIQYFYEGLSMMDKSMINVASGGALMDKTPATARHLISNMASNTQQFRIKGPSQSRMVNEIGAASNLRLENQLSELTSLVRQLAVGQHQPNMVAKVCGICTSVEHPTDLCPTLQEIESDQLEIVGTIGGYQYRKAESRATFSSTIRILTECASRTNRLSSINPTISSTNVPTTATIENATSKQFSIYGGPDEATCSQQFGQHAVPAKYECHQPRPQNTDRTISQHCEPFKVSRIQQPSLTNNSESERERECSHTKKRKRTIPTSTVAAEISQGRLQTRCQLTGAVERKNCPIAISNSDRLNKETKV